MASAADRMRGFGHFRRAVASSGRVGDAGGCPGRRYARQGCGPARATGRERGYAGIRLRALTARKAPDPRKGRFGGALAMNMSKTDSYDRRLRNALQRRPRKRDRRLADRQEGAVRLRRHRICRARIPGGSYPWHLLRQPVGTRCADRRRGKQTRCRRRNGRACRTEPRQDLCDRAERRTRSPDFRRYSGGARGASFGFGFRLFP